MHVGTAMLGKVKGLSKSQQLLMDDEETSARQHDKRNKERVVQIYIFMTHPEYSPN